MTLKNNLNKLGLKLKVGKTKLMYFNNWNILPGSNKIIIEQIEITSSPTVKFLGIVFDPELSFQQQGWLASRL